MPLCEKVNGEDIDKNFANILENMEKQLSTLNLNFQKLTDKSEEHFTDSISRLHDVFSSWSQNQLDPWTRPKFNGQLVPIFALLDSEKLQSVIDFTPKFFLKPQTFNGIKLYMWDPKNLRELYRKLPITLLLGIGYISRFCADYKEKKPKGKKKDEIAKYKGKENRGGLMAKWAASQKMLSYDSVVSGDGSITFWDPFCLQACFKVQISESIDFAAIPNWLIQSAKQFEFEEKPKGIKRDLVNTNEFSLASYPGFVTFEWDGRSLCVDEKLEEEINQKCLFAGKKDQSLSPFTGILI